MSKSILLAVISLLCFQVSAQRLKVDWGSNLKADSKYYDPSIVGEDENFLYAASILEVGGFFKTKYELVLEKVDKTKLKRKFIKTIKMPKEGKLKYIFEGMSFLSGNYVLFASTYNKKQKKSILKSFTIDGKTGKYLKDEVLFENDVEKRSRRGKFDIHQSQHGEMVLVHFVSYYKKKDQTKEEFKLINGELEILLEKSEIIEGRSRGYSSQFLVDDEGSVYFNRSGSIVVFDANQNYEEWSQPIELDELELGAFVTNFQITINTENDMILTGAYYTTDAAKTNEKKRRRDRKEGDTQVAGLFYMKINGISKETTISRINKFSSDFIDQFKTERDVKKGRDTEVNDIYGDSQTFFKEDGGLILVAERAYSYQITDRTGAVQGERYYFLDLLAFNFSPEGELIWANRIPKKQLFYWRTTRLNLGLINIAAINYGSFGIALFNLPMYELNHYSYVAGMSDNKLYIVFNDHVKNQKRKKDSDKLRTMKNMSRSVPTVFTIDLETGNKTKKVDLSLVSGKQRIRPSTFYQSSPSAPLYILSARKKDYKYGQIDLNEVEENERNRKTKKGRGRSRTKKEK